MVSPVLFGQLSGGINASNQALMGIAQAQNDNLSQLSEIRFGGGLTADLFQRSVGREMDGEMSKIAYAMNSARLASVKRQIAQDLKMREESNKIWNA